MPSQTLAIWAGATGAAIVVASAGAVYWVHPSFLWPSPVSIAVTERAPQASSPAIPVVPAVKEASLAPAGPAKEPPSAPDKPAFDVVSVQPTGETVVAGRAAPNAKVALRDAGKTVGEAAANAEGQFVIIPPPLQPGEHSLALAAGDGPSAETSNAIKVAVAAPGPSPTAAAGFSASPLSSATALAVPPVAAPASRVAVQSIEATAGGRLVAKGQAGPFTLVRLYLSGAYVGDVKTGADGRWSLTIAHGMTPGAYEIRADEIGPADARVAARAEAPFDYPATTAAAALGPRAGSPSTPGAEAALSADLAVDSIQTHHVGPGNTLWGISQKFYGDGARYEIIFAANSGQIRNPSLIYPGQTFVIPRPEPKP